MGLEPLPFEVAGPAGLDEREQELAHARIHGREVHSVHDPAVVSCHEAFHHRCRQVPLVGDLRWVRWPPDDDQDRHRWVLEFEGAYTVPSSCGGAWRGGRALVTLVVPNGMMTLISEPGARAAISFKTQAELNRCLGVGTRLRFASAGWTPSTCGSSKDQGGPVGVSRS